MTNNKILAITLAFCGLCVVGSFATKAYLDYREARDNARYERCMAQGGLPHECDPGPYEAVKPATKLAAQAKPDDSMPDTRQWRPGTHFELTKDGWVLKAGSCRESRAMNCMD